MNKEEILAMGAGSALDDLIAKKLFNAHTITKASKLSDKTFYALIGGEEEQYQPLEKGRTLANVWWRQTEKEAWDACPSYSTDISAAFEVLEKLRPEYMIYLKFGTDSGVSCEIREDGRSAIVGESYAETAPLAICKAALLTLVDL